MTLDYLIKFNSKLGIETSLKKSNSIIKDSDGNKYLLHIDGKISNLKELEKILNLEMKTKKDFLLEAIKKIEDIETFLLGYFVIIFYDYKNERLKVIRDTRGTKLVYLRTIGEDFYLSNNLRELIPLDKVTPNIERIKLYLSWMYKDHKDTFFNEINRLPPSHFLDTSQQRFKVKKFHLNEIIFDEHEGEHIEQFSQILSESVKSSYDQGKRLALMLSGGLDSSAIAMATNDLGYQNIKSYSGNFGHIKPSKKSILDEKSFQKNIISKTSLDHKFIELDKCSPIKAMKESLDIFSEPIAFPNIYLFLEIAKSAKDDQIDIILDGHDGDVIISHGYEVLFNYLRGLRFLKFFSEIFSYGQIKGINKFRVSKIFLKPVLVKFFSFFKNPEMVSKGLLNKSFALNYKPKGNISNLYRSHKEKINEPLLTLGNEYRYIFFKSFGIENRSPLYDEHFIRFCQKMPSNLKFGGGYTRRILRLFLEPRLGKKHAYRKDKAKLSEGLIKNFEQKDFEIVRDEYLNIHHDVKSLIDIDKLNSIFTDWENGNILSETSIIEMMYFYNLNIFMNRFF